MMSEWRASCAFVLSIALLSGACAEGPEVDETGLFGLTGVVLETMNGGGYTYAHVELHDTDMWVAGPLSPLEVGDTVVLVDTMAMGPFTSKTLDRTFEEMTFVMRFQSPDPVLGTAKQVIDAGGYTYVEVQSEGGDIWLAAPDTDLPEGAGIAWKGPMLMRDFHSPSLERTFSELLFVDSVWVSR